MSTVTHAALSRTLRSHMQRARPMLLLFMSPAARLSLSGTSLATAFVGPVAVSARAHHHTTGNAFLQNARHPRLYHSAAPREYSTVAATRSTAKTVEPLQQQQQELNVPPSQSSSSSSSSAIDIDVDIRDCLTFRDDPHWPTVTELRSLSDVFKPGIKDDTNFISDASVTRWRQLYLEDEPSISIRRDANTLLTLLSRDPLTLGPFLSYTFARAGVYSSLHQLVRLGRATVAPSMRFLRKSTLRSVREQLAALTDDVRRVVDNVHEMPWDMSIRARQMSSPRYVARAMRATMREMIGMIKFQYHKQKDGSINVMDETYNTKSTTKASSVSTVTPSSWLNDDKYPAYYKYGFHYQPNGWMSTQSADAYDILTETLFNGRQDAMQRLTLAALSSFLPSSTSAPRILEVAAGTGRVATFVRDNYRDAHMTVTDLSPYYLDAARQAHADWATVRRRPSSATEFVQAKAEDLPMDDGSVDVVYSVYLFHELPPSARLLALKEMSRVLRRGGVMVMTDSIQLGDRPGADHNLGLFGKYNEPWYASYAMTDFAALVEKASEGTLVPRKKFLCSSTKSLVFEKV